MSREVNTDNISTIYRQIPDRLFLNKIRTDRQRTAFFLKILTESRQRTGSRQKNSDRQTPDSIFSKNPDRIRTADRTETDKIRTDRHRTENPDRIRTPDRHRTGFSGKSGQKRDTDRTRTVLSADVCSETEKMRTNEPMFANGFSLITYIAEIYRKPFCHKGSL